VLLLFYPGGYFDLADQSTFPTQSFDLNSS
jgi:hypothetical protein